MGFAILDYLDTKPLLKLAWDRATNIYDKRNAGMYVFIFKTKFIIIIHSYHFLIHRHSVHLLLQGPNVP